MSNVTLQLRKLPGGYDALLKFAPRSDGFDHLDHRFVSLGFDPRAKVGDTVAVDLEARGLLQTDLPPGVVLVETIRLLQPLTARPDLDFVGLRAAPGELVHVLRGQAAGAIAAGLAEAA